MTNLEKYISLFPLQGELTQEIIEKAHPYNTRECQGALTLKAALGENISLLANGDCWGSNQGVQSIKEGGEVRLTTMENLCFPHAKTPQKVTFIIDKS